MTAEYRIKNSNFSPDDIAESGQCFRMKPCGAGAYVLVACGRRLVISREGDELVLDCSGEEFEKIWRRYFDLDRDYGCYREIIIPGDDYLRKAMDFGSGIRILNQEPFEMLISFIISQRRSVPSIRTAVEAVSQSFGRKITEDETGPVYAFPEPGELAAASFEELAACGLGYRVPYVLGAARAVSDGMLDLEMLGKLDTPALVEALMELKGVGIKVASCIALFAYHRLDTVPVDVWMKRVIDTVYGGSLPDAYRDCAGVIQQYLFNYARIHRTGTDVL